jgi:hypothetical protein
LWDRVIRQIADDDSWHLITPITSKAARVAFVPKSWLDVPCLKTADNRWNLYYQAEFRNAQNDVEVKLYLPATGDRSAQLALLAQLFPASGSAKAATNHFAPDTGQLSKYIAGEANSLKLYTVSANWKRGEDGAIDLDPGRQAKKDRKFQQFATAVQTHTQLITALA